jgi:ABC-type lipoprotein release transport system permease subunit
MDTIGPQVLDDFTEDVSIDLKVEIQPIFGFQNETSLEDIIATIANQTHILDTESVAYLQSFEWYQDDPRYYENTYLGVESSFFETFPNALEDTQGNSPFDNTSCWVEKETMDDLGLAIGDNYTARTVQWDQHGNRIENTVNFTIVGTFTSELFMRSYYWQQPEFTSLRMVTTQVGIRNRMAPVFMDSTVRDAVWATIDHSLILSSDPAETIDELENIRRRIEQRLLPYAVVPYGGYELRDAVNKYVNWVFVIRAIGVAFCIPTIFMGMFLVYYNSNLLADEQRRDVGTLKTRGASGRQAFSWIMGSGLFTAIVGSVGAIGTGIAGAVLSSTVRTFMNFNLTQLGEFTFYFTTQSIIFVFVFSFVMGLLVSIPAAAKALTITATEAHSIVQRENLLDRETIGNPFFDIVGFAISAYLLGPMLMMLGYGFSLVAIASMMLLVVPLLAIALFTFTRGAARIGPWFKSRVLDRIKRPRLAPASRVLSRATNVFKKSEIIGTMFIALVFTAGVFSSVSASTGYAHMEHLFLFETGADISVELNPAFDNMTRAFVDNLSAIEGVTSACAVLEASGVVMYTTQDTMGAVSQVRREINVIGVQPELYEETGFWLPYFAYESTPQMGLQAMQLANSNVLSSFKPFSHYAGQYPNRVPVYGDTYRLEIARDPNEKFYLDCNIVDTLSSMEGGGVRYLPGYSNLPSFVLVNLNYVQMALDTDSVSRYFVRIEDGANYTRIIQDIHEAAPNNVVGIDSAHEQRDQTLDAKAGQSVFGVYTLNVVFALVYLTAGMAVVSVIRVRKLRREFSIMRALGSDTSSIMLVVGIDMLAGICIASVIGSLFGIFLASLVSQIPLVFIGSSTTSLWTRLPVVPSIPTGILAGIIGTAFVFSLFAVLTVTWRCLQANIAEEIQYAE